jgi:hypothetical protein
MYENAVYKSTMTNMATVSNSDFIFDKFKIDGVCSKYFVAKIQYY